MSFRQKRERVCGKVGLDETGGKGIETNKDEEDEE
jgi:hypothetical protein